MLRIKLGPLRTACQQPVLLSVPMCIVFLLIYLAFVCLEGFYNFGLKVIGAVELAQGLRALTALQVLSSNPVTHGVAL